MVILLVFREISILFFTVAAPIYIPVKCMRVPFSPHLTSICYVCSFWWYLFWQVWGDTSWWFYVSLMISNAEPLLMCQLAICISKRIYSLLEMLSNILTFFHYILLYLCIYAEKAMAPHSSTLAWKIPWMDDSGGPQCMGLLRVGHDWATSLWLFTFVHWRRKWQPTPVFLPGESQGQGSLVGCRLWGHTESDTTEAT